MKEAFDFLGEEFLGELDGRKSCLEEDFVGIDVADATEQPRIRQ